MTNDTIVPLVNQRDTSLATLALFTRYRIDFRVNGNGTELKKVVNTNRIEWLSERV